MTNRLSILLVTVVVAVSGVSATAIADDERGDPECGATICADAWWSNEEILCNPVCSFDARGDHYLVTEDFDTDQDAEVEGILDILELSGNQDDCRFTPGFDTQCFTDYQWWHDNKNCWNNRAETTLYIDGGQTEQADQTEDSDGC